MFIPYTKIKFNNLNTPVSIEFDDVYYNTNDAIAESIYVFQEGNLLWNSWLKCKTSHFVIGETGFGSGLNFFLVLDLFNKFLDTNPNATLKRLFFISFEKYPLSETSLISIYYNYPKYQDYLGRLLQQWNQPIKGCSRMHFSNVTLDIWFGDALENLQLMGDYFNNKISAWFFDGFNPAKNESFWTVELFKEIYRLTAPAGSFATYTCAGSVKLALLEAGFVVEKRKGYDKKREMLIGFKPEFNQEATLKYPYYNIDSTANINDIAIIGGGIASLCLAISLLERGAKVTVYCEDEQVAMNASSNLQGALYPQLSDDDINITKFYAYAFNYTKNKLRDLADIIPYKHDFNGVVLCGYNEKATQKLLKINKHNWGDDLWQWLSAEQLSKIIGLPTSYDGGYFPHGGWLAPQQLVQNGFEYAKTLGLTVVTNKHIASIERQENQWLLYNQQNVVESRHSCVILANGHKITDFAQTSQLKLYPIRGQVSHVQSSSQLSKLKTVICYDGYLTPADTTLNSHCIGASHVINDVTREFRQTEQQENQQKIQTNLAGNKWVFEVDTSDNKARIGIRCANRDRIPMLGPVPDYDQQISDYANLCHLIQRHQDIPFAKNHQNLYMIGSLASRGLTSAPYLAEVLASMIYNEPIPINDEIQHALSPNRSWVRRLLKGYNVKDL